MMCARATYLVEVDGQLSFPDQEKSEKLSIEIKKSSIRRKTFKGTNTN